MSLPVKFNIVAAMLKSRGIGFKNTLPWPSLKRDYEHYIKLTSTPKHVGRKCVNIKGRLTWESTGLEEASNPNIINIVISTTLRNPPDYVHYLAKDLTAALRIVSSPAVRGVADSVWVMGGQHVYRAAVTSPQCERIYLTRIHALFGCDAYFPPIEGSSYRLISDPNIESGLLEDSGITYNFEVYERTGANAGSP